MEISAEIVRGILERRLAPAAIERLLAELPDAGKAQLLLSDPTRSIATIAFELGFDTPSNFTRSFKQWSGIAPSAFRSGVRPTDQPGRN